MRQILLRYTHLLFVLLFFITKTTFGQIASTLRTPQAKAPDLKCIIHSGLTTSVLGENGTVLQSTDTHTWKTRTSGFDHTVTTIVNRNNLYIIGCEGGLLLKSHDLKTWELCSTSTQANINSIAYSESIIVAVGDSGTIAYSVNGDTWEVQQLDRRDPLQKVCWNGSVFIAVGADGFVAASKDGKEWSISSSGYGNWLFDCIWDGKQFVAVGYNYSSYNCYGIVITSPDGKAWTRQLLGTSKEVLYCITQKDSLFYAAGYKGIVAISKDAATWEFSNSEYTKNLLDIEICKGSVIAVGKNSFVITLTTAMDVKKNN